MILGNAAWGLREMPLKEQLEMTKAMGLKLLELSIAGYPKNELQLDSSKEDIMAVKKMFDDYGILIDCASTGDDFTVTDPDEAKESLDNVCRVIDICSELGVKYLRVFAGFSPYEEVTGSRWDIMIECINKAAKHAKSKNVALSVETHGGVEAESPLKCRHFHSTTTRKELLKKIMEQTPAEVGFNYDPANLNAVGYEDPTEVFEVIKDRVNYVHLKDFAPTGDGWLRPAACGDGPVDWKKIMDSLKNFDGPALIEYEITDDAEEGFRKSLDFLRKFD